MVTNATRRRPLKVGLFIPHAEYGMLGATPRWSDIRAMAQRAEELGFDSLWLFDHLIFELPPPAGPRMGAWESWSLLTALAAATSRVELGTTVLCTGFRNPALLAKMADTTDEISGGRLILGLGAGWNRLEYEAFGYPFDARVARFEEAIAIITALLREGEVDVAGQYYQAHECVLRPRGPRPHGPPIMIGSHLGPRMLGLAARYADSWNAEPADHLNSPERMVTIQAALDAACTATSQDPQSLERTALVGIDLPGAETPLPGYPSFTQNADGEVPPRSIEEIAEVFRAYARAGVSEVQVWVRPWTLSGLDAFADVLAILDR
jgi:probable F420-dependent oxidoreductase